MNTYEIEVNLVQAGSPHGTALEVNPRRMEIPLPSASGDEHALVTWTFNDLPTGLQPVITFDSLEVTVSDPTTASGGTTQVTLEIKFPPGVRTGLLPYPAPYSISFSSAAARELDTFPPPIEEPSLVVVRSPDPPGIRRPPNPRATG